MGLLSSSKKTYVSSQTFPLNGEYEDRMNFHKTTVVGAVLHGRPGSNSSMSDDIVGSYLTGPGIKLKNFGSWLEREEYWERIGQGRSYIQGINAIDTDKIIPHISNEPNQVVTISDASIGYPIAEDFVYSYMLKNFPEFINYIDYSEEEWEQVDFSITLPNSTNDLPKDKALVEYKGEQYFVTILTGNSTLHLRALYNIYKRIDEIKYYKGEELENREDDSDYILVKDDVYIKDTKYQREEHVYIEYLLSTEEISSEYFEPKINILKGKREYEKPGYVLVDEANEKYEEKVSIEEIEDIYEDTPLGEVKIGTKYKKTITRYIDRSSNLTKVTALGQSTEYVSSGIYMYKEGEGIKELDDMFYGSGETSSFPFYPVMPVRVSSSTISKNHWGNVYELNRQGYRKLTQQNYADLVKQINSSEGLGDINTGFIQFGTALNTKDPSAMDYIWKYFDHYFKLSREIPNSKTWLEKNIELSSILRAMWNSYVSCINHNLEAPFSHMERSCSFPSRIGNFEKIKYYGVWNNNMWRMGYHIGFTWEGQSKITGKGKYKNLRPGEHIIENGGSKSYATGYRAVNQHIWEGNEPNLYWVEPTGIKKVSIFKITKQINEDNWEQLTVYNPETQNIIKDGKGVYTGAFDRNEGSHDSACILPLNKEILRQMSLKNLTQFSIGSQYLTFTAWKEVKKKWYQGGVFKIVTIAISIAVSIYFTPAGGGIAGGILGANAAVGSMIGLTGVAGVVAGAIANSIAAMVVTSVITSVATKIFGNTLGGIIGNIASFAVAQISSIDGGNLSFDILFDGLMKSDNILSLASSVGKGFLQYTQENKFKKLEELQKEIVNITQSIEAINKKMQNEFGKIGVIDPLELLDPLEGFIEGESRDEFLSRTLMLGSDVVEMTHNLINNYVQVNLDLSLK